mmetsp:Transcript_17883/g.28550  ORF Transcript_17883/g.28550 Transcript_17883/m.28550 type:complete len:231 (-) Transcript_17883:824-1516(-)
MIAVLLLFATFIRCIDTLSLRRRSVSHCVCVRSHIRYRKRSEFVCWQSRFVYFRIIGIARFERNKHFILELFIRVRCLFAVICIACRMLSGHGYFDQAGCGKQEESECMQPIKGSAKHNKREHDREELTRGRHVLIHQRASLLDEHHAEMDPQRIRESAQQHPTHGGWIGEQKQGSLLELARQHSEVGTEYRDGHQIDVEQDLVGRGSVRSLCHLLLPRVVHCRQECTHQ